MAAMDAPAQTDLLQFARAAAEEVAGPIEDVDIRELLDVHDRPAYQFSFLIDPAGDMQKGGLIMIKASLRIRHELEARGDPHRPLVHVYNRADWPLRHVNARTW